MSKPAIKALYVIADIPNRKSYKEKTQLPKGVKDITDPDYFEYYVKYGITDIEYSDFEQVQQLVDGYVEQVQIAPNLVVLCNEDGKIKKLLGNFYIKHPDIHGDNYDVIAGNAVFVGLDKNGNYKSLTSQQRTKIANILLLFRGISTQGYDFE